MYENTLILIHNSIIDIPTLDNKCQRLLIWIINKLRNQDKEKISFDYSEIIYISGLAKNFKPNKVSKFLRNFYKSIKPDNLIFDSFIINNKDKLLTVSMADEYLYLNNNLNSNYCSFFMRDLLQVNKSSQQLFLDIIRRRYIGQAIYTRAKIIKLLGISNNIYPNLIESRYLNPLVELLDNSLYGIKVTTFGRSDSRLFKFTWSKKVQLEKKTIEINRKQNKKKNIDTNIFNDLPS